LFGGNNLGTKIVQTKDIRMHLIYPISQFDVYFLFYFTYYFLKMIWFVSRAKFNTKVMSEG